MSDVLVEFVEPLWGENGPKSAAALRSTLLFASVVWNACQDGHGDITAVIESLRDEVAERLKIDASDADSLVEMLALRKSDLFADDPRIVVSVDAYEHGGEFRVLAASGFPVR